MNLNNLFNSFRSTRNETRPLINILTRTSNRPNAFKRCRKSIERQTYPNINHLVSYDDAKDLSYLSKYDISVVPVDRATLIKSDLSNNPNTGPYSPHNLYCNVLLSEVKEGWIIFLDDDDMLSHTRAVEEMVEYISNHNKKTMFIWQMKFPDGRLLPPKHLIEKKKIHLGSIGSPCFMFHSRYSRIAEWDSWKCGDYRFLKKLSSYIPHQVWIEKPYISLGNFGDSGSRNDIQEF